MQSFSKPLTVPAGRTDQVSERQAAKDARLLHPPITQGNIQTAPIVTCKKCGATGAVFICSTPGCPVNGGAAAPRPPVQLIPGYTKRPPPREQPPTRRGWEEFPSAYAERLRETQYTLPLKMGPMSWNDARFAQRELRYFFRALAGAARRRDEQAAPLHQLAQRLRISCPRTDDDPNLHWVILKPNPLS